MEALSRILNLGFLPEDTVCVSNSQYAYHSVPISSILSGEVMLVSPNEKVWQQTVKTRELTLLAINPILGFRNDDNVLRYQNFMWELDIGSLSSQMAYIKAIGLPYSAAIYSGNKSIHFLTCLEESMDVKTYKTLYQWALNIGTLFDPSCKNPSRCIRIPGNIRPDTNKKQELIELTDKIQIKTFLDWFGDHLDAKPKVHKPETCRPGEPDFNKLSRWAKKQFKEGIDFTQGRNRAFFCLACDLAKTGYSKEDAIDILSQYFVEESDFKEKEFLIAISSAYKHKSKE